MISGNKKHIKIKFPLLMFKKNIGLARMNKIVYPANE